MLACDTYLGYTFFKLGEVTYATRPVNRGKY